MPDELPIGSSGTFRNRFWPVFLLGLVGVATLPLILVPMLSEDGLPAVAPEMSLPSLVALGMVNPLLLLAAGAAIGAWIAPRLGLISLTAFRSESGASIGPPLRSVAPLAVLSGLFLAAVMLLLDNVFRPFLSDDWTSAALELSNSGGWTALISGFLYGGITEEIMLRWGMMSFLAWMIWRLAKRDELPPSSGIMWAAIILAAILFGIGHLPAAAAVTELDTALVLRTVILNALGGVVYGWMFWRRHLEAAMMAHASTHVGFALFG